jgi:hypothetical protein
MDAQIVLSSTALFQKGVKSKEPLIDGRLRHLVPRLFPSKGLHGIFGGNFLVQVAETHVSEKSLALIGNASGQDAEGAINCSEAFPIRRLERRRLQFPG